MEAALSSKVAPHCTCESARNRRRNVRPRSGSQAVPAPRTGEGDTQPGSLDTDSRTPACGIVAERMIACSDSNAGTGCKMYVPLHMERQKDDTLLYTYSCDRIGNVPVLQNLRFLTPTSDDGTSLPDKIDDEEI